MAVRGWGGSVATAIGVAAGAGAAQLGLGYGLGIIAWPPDAGGAGEAAWVASLGWATWIAATSTVIGAITADRLSGPVTAPSTTDGPGAAVAPLTSGLWRLALAVAAAVGALVTVALVAVPARVVIRVDAFPPQAVAAGYAVVGVLVGLLVASGALSSRAVAANVIATMGFLWALAVVTVIDGVAAGRGLATAQLGVWEFTATTKGYWFHNLYLPGLALALGSAIAIGALAAWPYARRSAEGRVGIAISGAVGPLLVATAYFLTAPGPADVPVEQLSAYLVAPYAMMAGLAGSVAATAFTGRSEAATRSGGGVPAGAPGAGQAEAPQPEVGWSYPDRDTDDDPVPAPRTPLSDPVRSDLADDGYAPARAYVSETTEETEPTAAVRGRAAVKAPLWPESPPDTPEGTGTGRR